MNEAMPGASPLPRILAIDGPAGAGKSTLAALMAARFRLLNMETGAMYRAFALKALTAHVALHDEAALAALSRGTAIELLPASSGNRVLLDGEDVTGQLRTGVVSEAASQVSVHSSVRAWMVALQQQMGLSPLPSGLRGVVMEGRDIGTVVFPQASVKVFLSASAKARTERRLQQEKEHENEAAAPDRAAVLAAIEQRDERDRSRAESPLRPAPDAVEIDSTALSLQEVEEQIAALLVERWGLAPA